MGKTFFNSFIVAVAALVLGACSGVSIPDVPGDTGTVKDCVGSAKKAHKTRHGTEELPPDTGDDKFTDKTIAYLDDFLDCAVGPAKTNEAKLLRGHAIVAVISRYAAYNAGAPVDGLPKNNFEPYDDLEDDVASTLASIEDAEYRLRVVSKVAKGDLKLRKDRPPYLHVKPAEFDLINAEYDEVQRIKRVLAVLRVFKNAAKQPTNAESERSSASPLRSAGRSHRRGWRFGMRQKACRNTSCSTSSATPIGPKSGKTLRRLPLTAAERSLSRTGRSGTWRWSTPVTTWRSSSTAATTAYRSHQWIPKTRGRTRSRRDPVAPIAMTVISANVGAAPLAITNGAAPLHHQRSVRKSRHRGIALGHSIFCRAEAAVSHRPTEAPLSKAFRDWRGRLPPIAVISPHRDVRRFGDLFKGVLPSGRCSSN